MDPLALLCKDNFSSGEDNPSNDVDSPNHNLEEEVAVDPFALTEEYGLNKKLDILTNKIKQRQKLNRLKEEQQMLIVNCFCKILDLNPLDPPL